MMRVVVVLALLVVVHAGRAPYLGGDIQELIEATKVTASAGPSAVHAAKKPVTEKQRRDSSNYNAKFADIARAYAEGYKAAIKAVQARAFIAKRRLMGIQTKSTIPGLTYRNPYLDKVAKSLVPPGARFKKPNGRYPDARFGKSAIPVPDDVHTQISPSSDGEVMSTNDEKGGVVTKSNIPAIPVIPDIKGTEEKKSDTPIPDVNVDLTTTLTSTQATVNAMNAMEKSSVPIPSDIPHNINERSAPTRPEVVREDHPAFSRKPVTEWTEEERSKIAKLNARARHRNIYFDGAGGDPFRGGGVLSVQNAINKKHRRRRSIANEEDEGYFYGPHYNNEYYAPRRARRSVHYDNEIYVPLRTRRSVYYGYYEPRRARRSVHDTHFVRHRRSHMPYLGQNLDALGVIRAVPKSWMGGNKKIQEEKSYQMAPAASAAYLQAPPMEVNPGRFTQFMSPTFRGTIPQPVMMAPPMAMNYAAMFQQQPQFQAFRSMIPGYPAFMQGPMGYALPAPMPRGEISEKSPSVETQPNYSDVREKKSTIPEGPPMGYALPAPMPSGETYPMPSGEIYEKGPSVETQPNNSDVREKKSTTLEAPHQT